MRPPFPAIWDSSMLSALRSCGRKFELEYLHNYKPKSLSVDLHAGKAFAEGLEVARRAFYEQGEEAPAAVEKGVLALEEAYGDFLPPADSPKTKERMVGALRYYFEEWPLPTDPAKPAHIGDRLGIEFSFAQPLPVLHPETGEPLILCGRADQISDFAGGIWIQDEKTTKELGPTWSRKWDLRGQFSTYTWAAREAGIRVDGVLVRGIAILKTKFNKAEAPTYRPPWQVDRWLEQTVRDLHRAIRMWEEGYWDYNLDDSCTRYRGCPYRQLCLIQDPQPFLELNYERRYWNPLTREEVLLDKRMEEAA